VPYKDPEKQREYQRKWQASRRKEWVDAHGPCALCGSWDDLQVDHIYPDEKETKPSQVWGCTKKKRDAELSKCQVLCKECHRIKTSLERTGKPPQQGHGTTKYSYGCRCQVCVKAKADYDSRRRKRCRH